MKAYLIDPTARTITEVNYYGNYQSINRFIDASLFDCVRIPNSRDAIFVDDEGLYNSSDFWFMPAASPCPLAGKGLMLGTDAAGESIEPAMPIEILQQLVHFIGRDEAIRLAEDADNIAREQGKKYPPGCFVHIPAADIIKDREYTDQSG